MYVYFAMCLFVVPLKAKFSVEKVASLMYQQSHVPPRNSSLVYQFSVEKVTSFMYQQERLVLRKQNGSIALIQCQTRNFVV
jgi:hypothetical protein